MILSAVLILVAAGCAARPPAAAEASAASTKMTDEEFDEVLGILTESAWDGSTPEARTERDKLYPLFKIEQPKPKPKADGDGAKKKKKKKEADELDSYAALVNEMGYCRAPPAHILHGMRLWQVFDY